MATSPAAASTTSTPTAPTIAGLLLAVLPAPDVLIAGGAADGVCAESDMPLSLSIGPFANHAAGRKFILRKMPQSPPPQCDAEHSMAQGQGCANHQQCLALPTKPTEPIGVSRRRFCRPHGHAEAEPRTHRHWASRPSLRGMANLPLGLSARS